MIDLENPPPGVMATKIQKIVTKFTQNAPAGLNHGFQEDGPCLGKSVFLINIEI